MLPHGSSQMIVTYDLKANWGFVDLQINIGFLDLQILLCAQRQAVQSSHLECSLILHPDETALTLASFACTSIVCSIVSLYPVQSAAGNAEGTQQSYR